MEKPEKGIYLDDAGQWWFLSKNSHRKRAVERLCHHCGRPFGARPSTPQTHCSLSHSRQCENGQCASVNQQQRVRIGAPIPAFVSDNLGNQIRVPSFPNRYRQDENGQWWYHWPRKVDQDYERRTKISVRICHGCPQQFLVSPSAVSQTHCSRSCRARCTADECERITYALDASHLWTGGRQHRSGYVAIYAPGHPSNEGGDDRYVLEHRLVMEADLGRFLTNYETVHHINGVRDDNRIENLQLRSGNHGQGVRYQCQDCGSHRVTAVPI